MSEMVEKVARAMVRLNFKHLPEAERDKGVNMVMNVTGDIERERARAAIAAMREATEAMMELAFETAMRASGEIAYEGPEMKELWQAMIDAALK